MTESPASPVAVLRKDALPRTPNMPDYGAARRRFDWRDARAALEGFVGGGLNIAAEALDRHVAAGHGGRLAVRFVDRQWRRHDLSYEALWHGANRCARILSSLGLGRGDRVFSLLGRCPELHMVTLGALKAGLTFCPLFTAFGPEPLHTRLSLGRARVLVTTKALYTRKVAPLRAGLPHLEHVLLVSAAPAGLPEGTLDFSALWAAADTSFETVRTAAEEAALLHFTSGTTGQPKGVLHVHEAVVAQHASARLALDLQAGDRYWCTADPGWVTGLIYGVLAPLLCGVSSVVDCEEFEPERWYRLLDEERVTVWYTAPTAVRMLMKAGTDLAHARHYPELRFLASVGEPLNPEAVVWGMEAFGLPFHDNWWQTETGTIMIANYAATDIKPGSMGLPLPGIDAAIVRRLPDGGVELIADADTPGELALRAGWPSMFRAYLDQEARYRACFAGDWYLSGDLARRDADGYYWFVGRGDDVIKSAGHLISPFEVESALLAHPAVAQAGVIGVPDPIAREVVKAFVELKPGHAGDEALRRELLAHARRRLGAAVAPREIAFVASLPRTRSGKIMRRVLRARELGLPEGDLSTLEGKA
ncbi:MAG: acetate--CoA ligase [Gammaproteobacteria bacterium]|nr:acetate--CoA ligase [Gammaproteobacteria bacterium]